MASTPITRKWTVPAAGKASLKSIIDDDSIVWVTYVTVRAAEANSGNVSWADRDGGQVGGYLMAGEAALLGDEVGGALMRDFTFYGTADDLLYFTIGASLG